MVKLYILGEVRLYRHGLALQLAGAPTLKVVGDGGVDGAVEALKAASADVALVDRFDIAEAVAALRLGMDQLRIVAFGVREIESEVLACATAGVDGYVRTDAGVGDVVTVIESVMRGELVCSPKVAASLYRSIASTGADEGASMTSRELEVVELIEQGRSNKEIANFLGIEPCTAKNHVQNILQKLGVHRRGEAVAKLRASGRTFGRSSAAA